MLIIPPHTMLVAQQQTVWKIYLVLTKKLFSWFVNNQMITNLT